MPDEDPGVVMIEITVMNDRGKFYRKRLIHTNERLPYEGIVATEARLAYRTILAENGKVRDEV